jgi:hypothetical protein
VAVVALKTNSTASMLAQPITLPSRLKHLNLRQDFYLTLNETETFRFRIDLWKIRFWQE